MGQGDFARWENALFPEPASNKRHVPLLNHTAFLFFFRRVPSSYTALPLFLISSFPSLILLVFHRFLSYTHTHTLSLSLPSSLLLRNGTCLRPNLMKIKARDSNRQLGEDTEWRTIKMKRERKGKGRGRRRRGKGDAMRWVGGMHGGWIGERK